GEPEFHGEEPGRGAAAGGGLRRRGQVSPGQPSALGQDLRRESGPARTRGHREHPVHEAGCHAPPRVHQASVQVPLGQRRHRPRRLERARAVVQLRFPEPGDGQDSGGARAESVAVLPKRGPWFLLLPLALLVLWHVAVQQRWVTEGIIPGPTQVAESWY